MFTAAAGHGGEEHTFETEPNINSSVFTKYTFNHNNNITPRIIKITFWRNDNHNFWYIGPECGRKRERALTYYI